MSLNISLPRALLALLAALSIGTALAQAPKEITPLNPPQPVENDGKIEVLEFFAYGCIHCANLEPKLEQWIKRQPADVKVKRVPAPFAIRGLDSIPLFYTLEAMGQLDRLHQKIFDAVNVENVNLGAPALLNKWLEKQGVDPKKYEEMQKSFSVDNKIKRARGMTQSYKIAATPTLVVNGRFLLEQAGSSDRMFENAERLIAEARQAARPAAAAKK
ncbi:MAG: thiol:disulfide interchange protein DsbA/DsbL [Burkholderiales bacterium]|nr:thiol:disulfide interchange protein DsbA/DsbL [Burkholderiales bacterium]